MDEARLVFHEWLRQVECLCGHSGDYVPKQTLDLLHVSSKQPGRMGRADFAASLCIDCVAWAQILSRSQSDKSRDESIRAHLHRCRLFRLSVYNVFKKSNIHPTADVSDITADMRQAGFSTQKTPTAPVALSMDVDSDCPHSILSLLPVQEPSPCAHPQRPVSHPGMAVYLGHKP